MDCIQCGGATIVAESRKHAGTVYRRRRCKACRAVFWTSEEQADENEIEEMRAAVYERYNLGRFKKGRKND